MVCQTFFISCDCIPLLIVFLLTASHLSQNRRSSRRVYISDFFLLSLSPSHPPFHLCTLNSQRMSFSLSTPMPNCPKWPQRDGRTIPRRRNRTCPLIFSCVLNSSSTTSTSSSKCLLLKAVALLLLPSLSLLLKNTDVFLFLFATGMP